MCTRWVCTDFIMSENFWAGLLDNGDILYVGYGEEVCPKTQKKHWQCWFTSPRRTVKGMRKLTNPRHIQPMRGSMKDNDVYCSKEGEMTHLGMRPTNANSTNNSAAKKIIDAGGTLNDIIVEGFNMCVVRWAELYLNVKAEREARLRKDPPEVVWCYGSTGTGKSRYAREQCDPDKVWVSNDELKWFCGVRGKTHVILDDFRGNKATFSWLLGLLDRYTVRVQVKNSHATWRPEKIYITSCFSPQECYRSCGERIDQLMRRITRVYHFTESGKMCVYPQGNTELGGDQEVDPGLYFE